MVSAMAFMRAIYYSVTYEPGATDVHTSSMEGLDLHKGVCRDFTHLIAPLGLFVTPEIG